MDWLHNGIVRGALSGALAAAGVDIAAFRSWKSFDDVHTYAWGLALFRWAQGAILGAMAAVGLGAL